MCREIEGARISSPGPRSGSRFLRTQRASHKLERVRERTRLVEQRVALGSSWERASGERAAEPPQGAQPPNALERSAG